MNLMEKMIVLRKAAGLSQESIADKLNVTRQTVSRWEKGSAVPSADNLKALAAFYGVSMDYLLSFDAEQPRVEYGGEKTPVSKPTRRRSVLFAVLAAILGLIAVAVVIHQTRAGKQDEIVRTDEMARDQVNPEEFDTGSLNW